jgi:taurine dioxygenase
MPLRFSPLSPALGVEVHELDPKAISTPERAQLRQAYREHGVMLARGLDLTPEQHVELTRIFGEPDIHPIEKIRLSGQPEVIVLAAGPLGDDEGGHPGAEERVGEIAWHSDLTYTALPSRGALLYARVVPDEGGQTGWVDTAAVYDALPESTKQRIAGLDAVHGLGPLQQAIQDAKTPEDGSDSEDLPEFAEVVHPLVHRHPETGRRALNVSPAFMQRIVGLSPEESQALLEELTAFATQPRFTYFHSWQAGDLIAWDNWRTMHVATGHERRFRRVMHRTTLHGGERLSARGT